MNILIVDDHPINRKLFHTTLHAVGHQTYEAEDGLEALKILKSGKIDVVISDLLMPNMDGYTLCRHVRSDQRYREIIFIIYSNTYTSPTDRKLGFSVGADKFLKKPSSTKDILTAISELQSSRKAKDSDAIALPSEDFVLKSYNELLITKLEEKNIELQTKYDELSISEAQFRQLVESIKEVYFIVGVRGSPMHYISPGYELLWGRSCKSLYENPLSWLDAIHSDDRPKIENFLQTSLNGFETEYRIIRPDSTMRWIRARSYPIRDKSGALTQMVGIAEDITENKKLQEQFNQAQKLESIGQLAAGIAHDFNNLLTVIIGYGDVILKMQEQNSPILNDLLEIIKAAKHGSSLTRQLLAFSRKQTMVPKIINLNVTIENLNKMLRRIIGEDIDLILLMDPFLKQVEVDPLQIEQVIMNLVVNSRDAMPNGGKLILETKNVNLDENYKMDHFNMQPGPYVVFLISDTGIGMDQKTQSRIFEPFFTTKVPGKGTGLGLAMVYGTIKQSGGYIWVYSEVGKGTTFKIYLPSTTAKPKKQEKSEVPIKTLKGSETILVAEDEDAVRRLVQRILKQFGYNVLVASNGPEALSISQQHQCKIDLLLTDTIMPQMSGIQLSKELRMLCPGIKVVYMSGYTDARISEHGLLKSEINFIEKPFTPQKVARKVREVLDNPVSMKK